MKKRYALQITRPDFLRDLMGGTATRFTADSMRCCLKDTTPLCYVTYTVLMEADIDPDDIINMNNDGESIGIKLRSKHMAKDIYSKCDLSDVRYGRHHYTPKIKQRDQFLICTIIENDPVDEEEDA